MLLHRAMFHFIYVYHNLNNNIMITENKAGFENMLQSGKTAQGDVIMFSSEKNKNISFQTSFLSIPKINITLDTDSNSIPYTVNITLTGFQIKFRINYTGNVNWSAIKV